MAKNLNFKSIVTDGLFITSVVMLLILFLAVLIIRSLQLTNIAKYLPDETQAFLIYDLSSYPFATKVISSDTSELNWLGGEIAYALIDDELVQLIEFNSKTETKKFLESLLIDDEKFETTTPEFSDLTISCFSESFPFCFAFVDSFLVLSTSEESILKVIEVQSGAKKLSSKGEFQNAKGRLPILSQAFLYVDLINSKSKIIQKYGVESGYLESIFRIFPTFSATVKMENTGWYAESFLAVDKSKINDEAFFRFNEKYEQSLLPYTQEFAFEWAGHELYSQLSRLEEIIEQLNKGAAIVFSSSIEEQLTKFLDGISLDDLSDVLDNEYYFGYTPNDAFLFMITLDNEEQVQKLAELKDNFARAYKYPSIKELDNGEVQADMVLINQQLNRYRKQQYFEFYAGDKLILNLALFDDMAVMSNSTEVFNQSLDKIVGPQFPRLTDEYSVLLPGSDEMMSIHVTNLPDGHILKTLLRGFVDILSTRKVFDDGIYSRHSLLFE